MMALQIRDLQVPVGAWEENSNSVVFLGLSIAHAGNLTNCWVCIHGSTHPTKGIPMLGVPIPLEFWGPDSNTSFVRFPPTLSSRNQLSIPTWWKAAQDSWKLSSGLAKKGKVSGEVPSSFCNGVPITIFIPSDGNYSVMSSLVLNGFDFYVMLGPVSCNQTISHPKMVESQCAPSYTLQVNQKCQEGNTPCRDLSIATAPGLYWLCGDEAHKNLPWNWVSTCTLSKVIPTFDVHSSLSWHEVSNFPPGLPRHRRAVETPLNFINASANASGALNDEITQVGQVTVENCMALAAQGGVCAVVNHTCCTWIDQHQQVATWVLGLSRQKNSEHLDTTI
uniref:Uncharacterized protein n=1 Tax=Crocodylus porosus TaxID=8502 RepID=A0A7M4F1L7_CROPO